MSDDEIRLLICDVLSERMDLVAEALQELLSLRQEVATLRAAKPAIIGPTYTRPEFTISEDCDE